MSEAVELRSFPQWDESINKEYVAELRLAKTPAQLVEFCARWREIFDKPFPKKQEPAGLGEFDAAEALRCIDTNRTGVCEHMEDGRPCAGARIILPELLLRATMVADQFKVPFNLCVHRLLEVGEGE